MTVRVGFAFLLAFLTGCASTTATRPLPPPLPTTPAPFPATVPDGWQNLDLNLDGVPGTSTDRALRELLAERTPARTVLVAVIDGGVDTAHVDLRDALWRNPGETAGNGVDDDGNGYVDDVFGWNFIGGRDGRNVEQASYQVTRLHAQCLRGEQPPRYDCGTIAERYEERRAEYESQVALTQQVSGAWAAIVPLLQRAAGVENLTPETVRGIESEDAGVMQARGVWLQMQAAGISDAYLEEIREQMENTRDYGLNIEFDSRDIVGDDFADGEEHLYGNADVMGPVAGHGTHVSGIIGAIRGNGLGMDGIASPNVEIMFVRAIPSGDERDKDVANAIRYAVDQGAQIINMSFGKSFSPRKELVDAAVRYADERGVLMVHAAGNAGIDLETNESYPNPEYLDGGRAQNWLTIGASGWKPDSLAASFSNYGSTRVDVFSPGESILSTVPGGEWAKQNGTSMAAPVVSGIAALLMAYFPDLTASDVKSIIMETAVPYRERRVPPPGREPGVPSDPVAFGSLSVTGGVVNTYAAVRRALELERSRD